MAPRTRLVTLADGSQIQVTLPRFSPPWVLNAAARRLRRLESYHQLAETLAGYDAGGAEHRRAAAHLQAQVALDQIDAAERNTNVIALATWALVLMTAALVAATVVLIVVTAAG